MGSRFTSSEHYRMRPQRDHNERHHAPTYKNNSNKWVEDDEQSTNENPEQIGYAAIERSFDELRKVFKI